MKYFLITALIFALSSFQTEPETPSCVNWEEIPSSFTPNGDGKNDLFQIPVDANCTISEYELKIFNRWGQELAVIISPNNAWHGLNEDGDMMPNGVYVWMLSYNYQDEEYSRNGQITLIR